MVNKCFKLLRKNLRYQGKNIINHVKRNHFDPWNIAKEKDICTFCGAKHNLTKEHVLPKWCFNNNPNYRFTTTANCITQTFIKTTIPVCSQCNNVTLSNIESYIIELFKYMNLDKNYFEYADSLNIIRWLEVIDYKFHVLNFRRKYKKEQCGEYISFLRDIPISVMRRNINLSPYKALSQLRKSKARIERKEKNSRYYSLVIFKSQNKELHFFHKMNEYIFFEFPQYKIALFYFFEKSFDNNFDAAKEAKQIITKAYKL